MGRRGFYNESDAYGFAFSDHSGPSPPPLRTIRSFGSPFFAVSIPPRSPSPPPTARPLVRSRRLPRSHGLPVEVLSHVGPPGDHSGDATQRDLHAVRPKPGTPYTFAVSATGTANGKAVRPRHHPSGEHLGRPGPGQRPGWSAIQRQLLLGAECTCRRDGHHQRRRAHLRFLQAAMAQQRCQCGPQRHHLTNEYVVTVQDPAAGVIFANIMTVSFTEAWPRSRLGCVTWWQSPDFDRGEQHRVPLLSSNPLTLGIPFVPTRPRRTRACCFLRRPTRMDCGLPGRPECGSCSGPGSGWRHFVPRVFPRVRSGSSGYQ